MPRASQSRSAENEMSMEERAVSVIAGLVIAAAGAKPRPNKLLNIAALAAGSYLALRGASGRCAIKSLLVSSGLLNGR